MYPPPLKETHENHQRYLKSPALWELTAREMQCQVPHLNRNLAHTPEPTPVDTFSMSHLLFQQILRCEKICGIFKLISSGHAGRDLCARWPMS